MSNENSSPREKPTHFEILVKELTRIGKDLTEIKARLSNFNFSLVGTTGNSGDSDKLAEPASIETAKGDQGGNHFAEVGDRLGVINSSLKDIERELDKLGEIV